MSKHDRDCAAAELLVLRLLILKNNIKTNSIAQCYRLEMLSSGTPAPKFPDNKTLMRLFCEGKKHLGTKGRP